MKRFTQFYVFWVLLPIISLYTSCTVDPEPGKPVFEFRQYCESKELIKDSMMYINAAGNHYEVNELQYFISEFNLWSGGVSHLITSDNGIHYVDIDIPSTLTWSPGQEVPAGIYDSVSFVFGINEEKNKSGLFVNPPERDMFWPEMMGGGYHLMKMNGKWLSTASVKEPFNLHLGIGMAMEMGGDEFVQNYFTITLPLSGCSITNGQPNNRFVLTMNIESWFDTPNTWDWNVIGGQIMQNQEAMHKAAENGKDAFSVKFEP